MNPYASTHAFFTCTVERSSCCYRQTRFHGPNQTALFILIPPRSCYLHHAPPKCMTVAARNHSASPLKSRLILVQRYLLAPALSLTCIASLCLNVHVTLHHLQRSWIVRSRPCSCPPILGDLVVDFADLAIIDLSKTHSPKGRAELAAQPRDTLRTNGFFYAINHGYTQAQVSNRSPSFHSITHLADQRDRIFDIADVPFTGVPPQERTMYSSENEKVGYYAGYKARRYWASRFPCPICPSFHDASEVECGHREQCL